MDPKNNLIYTNTLEATLHTFRNTAGNDLEEVLTPVISKKGINGNSNEK